MARRQDPGKTLGKSPPCREDGAGVGRTAVALRRNRVWFAQGTAGRPVCLEQSEKDSGRRGVSIQGPASHGKESGPYLEGSKGFKGGPNRI